MTAPPTSDDHDKHAFCYRVSVSNTSSDRTFRVIGRQWNFYDEDGDMLDSPNARPRPAPRRATQGRAVGFSTPWR